MVDLGRVFDKENVSQLITAIYLSALVYDDPNLCRRLATLYGVSIDTPEAARQTHSQFLINMLNTRTHGFVRLTHCTITRLGYTNYLFAEDADTVYIVFMGTSGSLDAIVDVTVKPSQLILHGHLLGHVHSGFLLRANGYSPEFMGYIHGDKRVVFAGHSLGGAIAMIKAMDVLLNPDVPQAVRDGLLVVTLGCPLLFDAMVQDHITEQALGHHFVSLFHHSDPVPLLSFNAETKLMEIRDEEIDQAEEKRRRRLLEIKRRRMSPLDAADVYPGDFKPVGRLFELDHSPANVTLIGDEVFEQMAAHVYDFADCVSKAQYHRIFFYVDLLDSILCPGCRSLELDSTLESFAVIEKKLGDIEGHASREKREMLRAGAFVSGVLARWSGSKLRRRGTKVDVEEEADADLDLRGMEKLFSM
ncbi:Lipase (class 3) [Carpediemonas membranifera]|uniref:Lipase (Class 3) n=1 Tax=Carpediemonas membranifera TaxID=201153 RepID=A0A8J6E355_9EUKA|nr:Lipase (class 3) [Carpediemonas membranifera]|eukprot:KAG9395171.1 Lipase (class 3) [Carpediemonas membranifera]